MDYKKIIKTFVDNLQKRYFRINVIIFFVILFFSVLNIKLFAIFHSQKHKKNESSSQEVRSEKTEEKKDNSEINRLDIVDRNGVLLARNVIAYDFYVYPSKVINIEENLNRITEVFPALLDRREKLLETMKNKAEDGKAVLVKQNIFASDRQKILDHGILGVEFQETQRRIYPHNNTASHILGFLSVDGDGMMGVERYFDSYLKNTANEKPIQLSIDINIQNVAKHVLYNAVKRVDAKAGVALIVKVKTGELIAAVSLPDFNPNNLREYNNDDLFNRFSLGVYELGSVFKIFLAALAIENGISPTKLYNTKDPFVMGKYTIHNFAATLVREKLNLTGILQHSSNIGCARIIEEMGIFYKQKEMFQKLGLLDRIDIELPETARPLYEDKWKLTQAVVRSYGHGIAVTPINYVYGVASIINDGKVVKPTLIKIQDDVERGISMPISVVSSKTSKQVRDILRIIVAEGSGKQGAAEKYDVGGKTGTAMKLISKTGGVRANNTGYDRKKNGISFVAAVPMKDPEYVYYILIDEPNAERANVLYISGGRMVAPAMSELISITGPMLNIPIENNVIIRKNDNH